MVDLSKLYVRNHRSQQQMLVGGTVLALVFSLAPRNERALFVIGDRPAPKAFAAVAPPPSPAAFNGLFDDAGGAPRRAYQFRAPGRRVGVGTQGPDGLTPSSPGLALPAEPSPDAGTGVGAAPGPLASLGPSGPGGGGIPGAPLAGAGPQDFGPAAPGGATSVTPVAPTDPVTPITPVTPVDPVTPVTPVTPIDPVTPVTPVTPVAAVPEPATWAMMLVGFFGIGAMLRRRVRSVQLESVALEA